MYIYITEHHTGDIVDIVLYAEGLTQEDNTQHHSTDVNYRDILCLTLRAPMSTTGTFCV